MSNTEVQDKKNSDDGSQSGNFRAAAKKALLQLLEPLAGFVSDSGLSAGELNSIFREAAVRSAAAKQLEVSSRVNISGIAATTGIPRADVSRILRVGIPVADATKDDRRQSTNRMLSAWYSDPKFTGPNGLPADLKIYGRGATFDVLAKKYGRGIPTRAVLDELSRSGSVELLATQRVRAKSPFVVERGMSVKVIKIFGDRATELLSTMLRNMRQPEKAQFFASVSSQAVLRKSLPLLRREVSAKSADLLADLQEGLLGKQDLQVTLKPEGEVAKVTVTVFYHESLVEKSIKQTLSSKRRNLRRER